MTLASPNSDDCGISQLGFLSVLPSFCLSGTQHGSLLVLLKYEVQFSSDGYEELFLLE